MQSCNRIYYSVPLLGVDTPYYLLEENLIKICNCEPVSKNKKVKIISRKSALVWSKNGLQIFGVQINGVQSSNVSYLIAKVIFHFLNICSFVIFREIKLFSFEIKCKKRGHSLRSS